MALCFFSHSVFAIKVESRIDQNPVGVGQPFVVSVQVLSEESVDATDPELPDLSEFDLVGSWTSQSSSSHLVQGAGGMEFKSQKVIEHHYQLVPQKKGDFKVGAFRLKVDGTTYQTKPLTIKVVEQGAGGSNLNSPNSFDSDDPLAGQPDPMEKLFEELLQKRSAIPKANVVPKNPNEVFFVHLDIDKKEAYVGEQITVSWYLYTKGQILSMDRLKFPDLKGFWKEVIEEVPALTFTPEVINGVVYRRALLASHALFPIKAGTSVIDEYKVKATVQSPSTQFGGFTFSEPYSYQRSSDRVQIRVKPLPTDNQPQDFSGAVGQFNVTSSLADPRASLNQPFALKIRFEGLGNAKLIELPEIAWPQGLEYFDAKSDSKFFKNGRSLREYEVLLIPRVTGELIIPAMSFSFFDPATQQYYSKSTSEHKIIITGEMANADANSGAGTDPSQNSQLTDNKKAADKSEIKKIVLPPFALGADLFLESRSLEQSTLTILGILNAILFLIFIYVLKKELFTDDKKRSWQEYLNLQIKLIKKGHGLAKAQVPKSASVMINALAKLVGAVTPDGASDRQMSLLILKTPPSFQQSLGQKIIELYDKLNFIAFAPEADMLNKEEDFKIIFSDFKTIAHKILEYLVTDKQSQ